MARSSRPPSPNPPSTSSSANASPRNSRCSGRRKALIGSCRPEPAPSTVLCATCLSPGIRPCPPTMSSLPHSLSQPEQPPTVSVALHDMSLTGFLELATPESIRQDGPLILGDRSLDLQQQLVVRVVRNRMMKEDNLAASTPELLEKQDLVGMLASQAIRALDRQTVQRGIPDCSAQ